MSKKNEFLKFPLSYELSFLIIGLIFGIMFISLNPPFHANDEDRHFLKVYHMYESGLTGEISKDSTKIGTEIPVNLTQIIRSFQGIPYHQGKKLNKRIVEERSKIPLNPNNKQFEHNNLYRNSPIPYIPHFIGLVIGKNIDNKPIFMGYAARYGGLIFYLISMFLIIRMIPVYKPVFFLYGLTPMVLYQASSVTYDTLNIVISFLFLALFLFYTFDNSKKVNLKTILIFFILAIILQNTKNGYFLIPLLTLLIPNSKFDVKGNPLIYKVGLLILFIIAYKDPINYIWMNSLLGDQIEATSGKISATLQKDFYKSQQTRLSNFISNPFHHIGNLWLNLLHFKKEWFSGIFGRFGYSYSTLPNIFYIFHGLILIFVASIASGKSISLKTKLGVLIIGLLTSAGVIFGFYLFSPVGANMIFGFQGRYLVPAIPLVLFILFNNEIKLDFWDKWGSTVISVYTLLMLTYAYSQMDILFYEF